MRKRANKIIRSTVVHQYIFPERGQMSALINQQFLKILQMTHILKIFMKFCSSFGRLPELIIKEMEGEIALLLCTRKK